MSIESAKLAPQLQRREIKPQPGPQTTFLSTKADIAIYGGAAGGGKTFGLLMEPLRHISIPSFGAVIFRRTSVQVRNEGGLWDESSRLYPHVGGKPKEYDLWWKFPSGASVSFAHLEHDKNVLDWQGSQIALVCCEVGTNVRLGDGSLKAVELLQAGDFVDTLQGPKKVTKVHEPKEEDCVEVTIFNGKNEVIASQVQAKTHSVLTPNGWLSYDIIYQSQAHRVAQAAPSLLNLSYGHKASSPPKTNQSPFSYAATQLRASYKYEVPSASKFLFVPALPDTQYSDRLPFQEYELSAQDRLYSQETFSYTEQEALESDSLSSLSKPQALAPPLSGLRWQELFLHFPSLWQYRTSFAALAYDEVSYAGCGLEAQDYRECYSTYTHPYGEHEYGDLGKNPASVQLQVYAAQRNHTCSPEDVEGTVQGCSRQAQAVLYFHPYTEELRLSVKECQLLACDMVPCGVRKVVHFAVDEENHYITESGLVNKNCFDELTHFTAAQFWYMLSRNRSTCGIRPYVRATTNPDCESWVADLIEWWIDQDTGYPIAERAGVLRYFVRLGEKIIWADSPEDLAQYKNPMTGEAIPPKSLTFIPSLLADNQILARGDPGYLANLMALPLVERERLLNGNWKVRWQGQTFFSLDAMLDAGRPVPYPEHCDGVFAVLDTASKTGSEHDGTAVIWCARSKYYGHPLVILDWDYVQISGALLEGWLPEVFRRGTELATLAKARNGFVGAWVEDKNSGTILLQQAVKRNMKVRPINSKLTAIGKDERAFSVSGYVANGKVKISDFAFRKTTLFKKTTKNHLVSQIENFSIADEKAKTRADDLLDAFVYCVALALGNHSGF